MAEENLGSAKLVLTADDKDLSDKLRAAKQQVDELGRQAGITADAFSKFFSKTYRLNINDSQLEAANIRLNSLKIKLTDISSRPFNVRLNVLEGGLAGGGKDITRESLQKRFQEATRGGLSGQLTNILAGDIGGLRTADLRSTLGARLQRSSLAAGGFNVPGLKEVISQLGGTPSGSRGELVKQAQDLLKNVGDAVINKVGQDLLDLKLQLTQGAGGGAPPGGGNEPPENRELKLERARTRLVGLAGRLQTLEEKGVDVANKSLALKQAISTLNQGDLRATNLLTQRLESALKLEENRLRIANLRSKGFASTPEEIAAGTSSFGTEATNRALDKRLGLERRINILEAKGIDVAGLRAQISRAQVATDESNLKTANQILRVLTRQVNAEENALKVSNLRAAAAKKLKAETTTPSGPPPPSGLPPTKTPAQQRREAEKAAARNRDIAGNAIIGGAFPLLFGQGIGASIGGAAGGAAGGAIGGQFGFGLSLVGTAVGSQFDALLQKGNALAAALSDPIGKFGELREAGLFSSRAVERSAEALIALGANATAAAVIQRDLEVQYGKGAVSAAKFFREQEDIANRSNRQTDVTLGPFFNFIGAEIQRAGRRITEPGFGIFPSTEERNRPKLQQQADQDRENALTRIRKLEQQRLATQGDQLRSIAAQAQGYDAVAAALDQQVKTEQNATDVADARRRLSEVGPGPNKAAEQAKIQNEINQLVSEGVRDQQAYEEKQKAAAANTARQLTLTKQLVGLSGEERRFAEQRFDISETERRLKATRDAAQANPEDRGLQASVPALKNQLLTQQLNLQEQLRASAVQRNLQLGESKINLQNIGRQIAATQELAKAERGVARETLATTQAIQAGIDAAKDRERQLGAQIDAARQTGNEELAARLVNQQKEAANQTRLQLEIGAEALTRAGEQLRDNLRNAVVEFTRVRSDPQGLNKFLNPAQQQQRAERDFQTLLPQFRAAQTLFQQLTGAQAPDVGFFRGSTADINEGIRDFIQRTSIEDQATRNLVGTQQALNTNLEAYTKTIADLAVVTKDLAGKNWIVNLNQGPDGRFNATGDVTANATNRAISP